PDEVEDDLIWSPRHKTQRREATRARIVVFEKEPIDRQLAEQRLGDMVVAALGHPGRAEIAAAHMGAYGHPGGPAGERLVDEANVGQVLRVAVAADARHIVALGGIVEIGEAGVVEPEVGAAESREPR